jgi:hypothetical protein
VAGGGRSGVPRRSAPLARDADGRPQVVSDASQNHDRLAIEIFRPAAKATWFRPEIEKLLNDATTYLRPLAQAQ